MLTQTIDAVPQQVFTWAVRHETWLHRRLQLAALRKAQTQAYYRFALEHPRWADSLFDADFLSYAAAPLIARMIEPTDRPTPSEFAAAWFEQCKAPGAIARATSLAEVTLAASAFLRYLEAELQANRSILS